VLSHNIGKGYSSQVFRGRNDVTGTISSSLDETVAIKVIDMKMIKGEVHKNLLASEIDVLKILKNSENIIEVYDIYNTKNNTYIITELCDGGDMSKLISNRKQVPEAEAVSLMNEVLNGYAGIYSRGIIHRDLKPANIFLRNNHIKIADFGFAMKHSDCKKTSSYNVGSPVYMPPEALNENKYSFKSDIWALGVIYYEMLTGKTPWRAKTEK
jgi:serine/threonine protein kinase